MMNQRIKITSDPKRSMEWTSPPHPPLTLPNESNVAQAKRYVESLLEQYPGASLGSAFFLGLCLGWLIKRR